MLCRTLHGCVDWNNLAPYVEKRKNRRTLHGCVDWNTVSATCEPWKLVAPYTGAWIEISKSDWFFGSSIGRTLHGCVDWNFGKRVEVLCFGLSHPTRVRGLKYYSADKWAVIHVAPYTGAWIEIWIRWNIFGTDIVAPYTGAWIEISLSISK